MEVVIVNDFLHPEAIGMVYSGACDTCWSRTSVDPTTLDPDMMLKLL